MRELLQNLENRVNSIGEELSSTKGKCEILTEQINTSENKLNKLKEDKETYTKAVELLTIVQKTTSAKIKAGLENIVTYALRYVFNSDYGFQLEFSKRGNLSEVKFNVKTTNCKTYSDPLLSEGGGILDILSLALRIAILELYKPKIEGFVALDEPFKQVSVEYLDNCRKFIKAINQRINRQIIIVTHKEELITNAEHLIKITKEE